MKTTKGYLTPCDQSEPKYVDGVRRACPSVMRLSKPGKWRCDNCTVKHGPLPK